MSYAIRVHATGGVDRLKIEETVVGEPGPGEARVRHHAIGLNYVETYLRTGLYPVPLPSGLGTEAAGVVEAIGSGVSDIRGRVDGGRRYLAGQWSDVPALCDKHERGPGTPHFGKRLRKDDRVVLGQPVFEKCIRDPDGNRATRVGDKRRWLEPGVKAVPIHLCFDAGENLIPDAGFHGVQRRKNLENSP